MYIHYLLQFCDIDVRASQQGINPYSGQWEDIGRNMAWHPMTYALYVCNLSPPPPPSLSHAHREIPYWHVSH